MDYDKTYNDPDDPIIGFDPENGEYIVKWVNGIPRRGLFMNHIDREYAHTQLISRHNSLRYESDSARLSLRKDAGTYFVTLHDKTYSKTTKQAFRTLPGALTSAELLLAGYL